MQAIAYILIILLFNFNFNLLYADYMVVTNRSVNLVKEKKVSARMDLDKKIIEGFGQISPSEKKGMYILDITWINILDQNGKIPLPSNALSTTTELKGVVLTSGTSLLVKGSVSDKIIGTSKEEDDKEDDKRDYLGSSDGSSTEISAGVDNPIDPPTGSIVPPALVTTYDGCNQVYDAKREIINVSEQTYYIDENNNKKIKEECHVVKAVPADKKTCSTVNDFIAHLTYTRFQPTFVDEGRTYSAGGCVIDQTYFHEMDYNVCEAIAYDDQYIKQGEWYYKIESGEKVYISGCVLDPYAEANDLLIKFEGCPVYHDIEAGQSKYLGKYYWIKPDNTQEFLGDCVDVGERGYFIHKIRWDGEWNYGEYSAQRILTRYIYIDNEERELIIDDEELDVVSYDYDTELKNWEHHDDLSRGAPDGVSMKQQIKYFNYEDVVYYVPGSDFSEDIKHIVIEKKHDGEDNCGGLNADKKFWYIDVVQRGDLSTYETNRYTNGCP